MQIVFQVQKNTSAYVKEFKMKKINMIALGILFVGLVIAGASLSLSDYEYTLPNEENETEGFVTFDCGKDKMNFTLSANDIEYLDENDIHAGMGSTDCLDKATNIVYNGNKLQIDGATGCLGWTNAEIQSCADSKVSVEVGL